MQNETYQPSTAYADSKKHYEILDGLRGVAAVVVVLFHVFEVFSGGDHHKQLINHGYLAVDFFFVLSGFVIGHAYDDRWSKMTLKDFFKRRIIRLHPMIILGMTIGAICFYFSGSPNLFPLVDETPFWEMLGIMLIGYTMLPVPPSMDIRGWSEMYPLNGPAWSLFFEYIANVLYALVLRRLPNMVLAALVVLSGAALIHLAVMSPKGDIIGGWAVDPLQLRIGFTRLLYPFLAGLLLSRLVKPGSVKYAFGWCSLLLVVILAFPRVGDYETLWMNGLYDSLSIILLFPLIVYLGASGEVRSAFFGRVCRFLGDISYPIYIVHFPLIYVYYAWVDRNSLTLGEAWFMGLLVLIGSIVLAYAALRLWDIPVRRWLVARFMPGKRKNT